MEKVKLKVLSRELGTKGYLKQLRRSGYVPGVIYGHNQKPRYISIDAREFSAALHTEAGTNVILDINIDDKKKKETVMVKDLQRELFHPENLSHVDLIRISLKEKVDVDVPIHLHGEPEALKEGGVLQMQTREIAVRCLPTEIPSRIEADISSLDFGDSILLKDLDAPEGVEFLGDPETVVVTILAPTLAEEAPEAEAEAEGEETPVGEEGEQEEAQEEG